MLVTEYGGFWNRFAAAFIDGVILSIGGSFLGGLLGVFYGLAGGTSEDASVLGFFLGIIWNWLYFAIMESSAKQATLGKMAIGLVVTDKNDNRLTFARATARYFAKWLSSMILMIGYIMAVFTKKKQALHDKIAGTVVYQRQPSKAGGIIAGIVVGFIGLIFVLNIIAFPGLLNMVNKAKQSYARSYISSINKGQQAYYQENSKFSDNINDLGLGIKSETTNYSYDISRINSSSYIISTATAKYHQLKSYFGIVYLQDSRTQTMICETDKPSSDILLNYLIYIQNMIYETDKPSSTALDDFEFVDRCPSGSSKL
ncbi:MAG: type IV pilin-like G/H family protein [Trichodesmium sp. MO_231.B1]|nr:type IV pilin-like G/H family protein [Trichodesmium sp. MO_231.B1]